MKIFGRFAVLGGLAVLVLAGCAAKGPVDQPIARSLAWFSYVGGDDIRAACVPNSAARYRLVYNARYTEQIRSYDITALPMAGGAILAARVRSRPRITAIEGVDPLAPWRMQVNQRRLDAAAFDGLVAALAASGAFEPSPPGLRLHSETYYWVVAACRDGRFTLHVFDRPAADLSRPVFVRRLAALDPSPVPLARPQPLEALPPPPEQCGSRRGGPREGCLYPPFVLETGDNGLIAGATL